MLRPYKVEYSYTVYGETEVMADDEDDACEKAARRVARESGEVTAGEVDIDACEETEASPMEYADTDDLEDE